MSVLFLGDAFELLNGRPTNLIRARVSLALNNNQTVRMDGKSIDTEVVRFPSGPWS
jgi:hypothetical protein